MTHRSQAWINTHAAARDAYFMRVLAAFGCNPDGSPIATPTEFGDLAGGNQVDFSEAQPHPLGSLNANLPGQMEFFSVKRTSRGLEFEIIVTDE